MGSFKGIHRNDLRVTVLNPKFSLLKKALRGDAAVADMAVQVHHRMVTLQIN